MATSYAPVGRRGGRPAPPPERSGWSVVAAVVLAGTAGLVAANAARADLPGLGVGALAGAPWAWLPALAVLVGALAVARRVVALAGVVVLALPVWWTATQDRPWSTAPAAPAAEARLTVLDANVTWTNDRAGGMAAQIARDHPDVVAMEEVTPGLVAQLDASGVLARYRYQLVAPDDQSAGMALWSDRPLSDAAVWDDAGHPELRARLAVGGRPVWLMVVHTFIPVGLPVAEWRAELAGIGAAAARLPGPEVVVGDFNATWDLWEYRSLLSAGRLTDGAVSIGDGWRPTWAPHAGVPAVLTLDHVLTSRGVRLAGYRLGPVPGGQHRSLLVTLAVSPGRS